MLHTKFSENRPAGSGEDFSYMGMVAILIMCPKYHKSCFKHSQVHTYILFVLLIQIEITVIDIFYVFEHKNLHA